MFIIAILMQDRVIIGRCLIKALKMCQNSNILERLTFLNRSQCPRARTLGSWVRIPLEARMSVSVYSVYVLFCV
jgi:hypothetical protein